MDPLALLSSLLPEALSPAAALALMAVSFTGSFITISFGIGGGALLLAVMASLMPPAALVPVHGLVQFGSNAGRTAMTFRHIRWRAIGAFAAGGVAGIVLASRLAVNLPAAWVQIGVGLFLIWSVLSKPPQWMRHWPALTGAATSVVSMFFGASGPFVATWLKTLNLERHAHVATQAVLLAMQHLMKTLAFGLLGFAYAPWAGFITLMILCGLAGTWSGKRVLNRMTDARFRQTLNAILLILAARLVWAGIAAL